MPEPKKRSLRILVVDDESGVRLALQMMFKHLGHQAMVADGGVAALSFFESETFDLVITDFLMPGMSGEELIEKIKEQVPDQRIIVVSAFGDNVRASGKMAGKVDCVLNKPFGIAEIKDAIAKVVA